MLRYKTGLKPPRAGAIRLSMMSYVDTAKLPPPPGDFGHYDLVKSWCGFLGNENYGDCAWAGGDHQVILWNAAAGRAVSFTEGDALYDYASTGFDPATGKNDDGTDLGQFAQYFQSVGLRDSSGARHKVLGSVAFNPSDPYQLAVASYYFLGAGVGVNLFEDADDDFDAGKPWDFMPGMASGGEHYTPTMGRKGGIWMQSTWGGLIGATPAFMANRATQGVAFVSPDIIKIGGSLDVDGFGLNELLQDLASLASTSGGTIS